MSRRVRHALLISFFFLALFPVPSRPVAAALRAAGPIASSEQVRTMPAYSAGTLSRDQGVWVLTGEVTEAAAPFDHLGVHWIVRGDEEALYIETRASANGSGWGPWRADHSEEDMANLVTGERYAQPYGTGVARFAQYRVTFTAAVEPGDLLQLALTFIDAAGAGASPLDRLVADVRGALADLGRSYVEAASPLPRIMTRADWGADESLVRWFPKYQTATKVVIHHTAGTDGGSNIPAVIRAIYFYHAVTRGWGDIGYSYLLDRNGTIWAGRQGGDNAIAGHAYGWNDGSLGIAAIGEYGANAPSAALVSSLAALIALRFAQAGIAPTATAAFVHKEQRPDNAWVPVTTTVPNIIGHRDCAWVVGQAGGQTSCPGGNLYQQLEPIRQQAQRIVDGGYERLARLEPSMPRGASPGGLLVVPVVITNRGTLPIPAGTVVSYQMITNGVVNVAQGQVATLPAPLAPGVSITVTVPVPVPGVGAYIVRWDLQTGSSWWNAQYGTPFREVWLRSADWSADWIEDDLPPSFVVGETRTVKATIVNDGGRAWSATSGNPVRLTYSWRNVTTGVITRAPLRAPLPQDVTPGAQVAVTYPVTAPASPGSYVLTLDLEKENEFRFGDRGVTPDDTTIAVLPVPSATPAAPARGVPAAPATGAPVAPGAPATVGQPPSSPGARTYGATYAPAVSALAVAGSLGSVALTVMNTGSFAWPAGGANPVTLSYHWAAAAGNAAIWDGARTRLAADVPAGGAVTLQAAVRFPASPGTFTLRWDLVEEGVTWFSAMGVPTRDLAVAVNGAPVYAAVYDLGSLPASLPAGTRSTVKVVLYNGSNFSWDPQGGVNLSYHWQDVAGNTVAWEGARTPLAIAPGTAAIVNATVVAPTVAGTYGLRFDLVQEGVTWFSGQGVFAPARNVRVDAVQYGATYTPGAALQLVPSSTSIVPLTIRNTGSLTWRAVDGYALAYHVVRPDGSVVQWDGLRTALPGSVGPGEVVVVFANVQAPGQGSFVFRFDLVREGVSWFSDQGVPPAEVPARVG
ncbi:MAG: hypothetical protein EXR61_04705 [Chloroflexi bacterium]|nr:hypothetical protein [Chloroflexota bacterium]